MKVQFSVSILSLLYCGALLSQEAVPQRASPPPENAKKIVIAADDLNGRYVVLGPLGVPLGEVITVAAEAVEYNRKGETDFLKVVSVNGRKLKEPVEMAYRFWGLAGIEAVEKAKVYRLRVYQDGRFDGVPRQVMEETALVQTHGYMFSTHLVVVRSLEPMAKVPMKQR